MAKSSLVRHPCGCVNDLDACGVTKCVSKCADHVTWALAHPSGSLQNYVEMGCLRNGIPQNAVYIHEFEDGFGELEEGNGRSVLEVGCGLGMCVPLFLRKGWRYFGHDISQFAAHWVSSNYDVFCEYGPLDYKDFDLVFASHVLEHMPDAPQSLERMYNALNPGGRAYILVPDDTDQTNPDHWWFFTESSLTSLLCKTGFSEVKTQLRRRVLHEQFIYAVGTKI